MAFTLLSTAFVNGEDIPVKFTCDGEEHSPELTWGGAPERTDSFALLLHDPDAPSGDFTHWILFNIPADVERIPESTRPDLVGEPGTNDFENVGYGGPCPPSGDKAHGYIFTLYALDTEALPLGPTSRRKDFEAAIAGHVLAQAELTGYYGRRKHG